MEKTKKIFFIFISYTLLLVACNISNNRSDGQELSSDKLLNFYFIWAEKLNESIINDFYSPPVASRIYMYSNLAINTTIFDKTDSLYFLPISFSILNKENVNRELASLFAFYYTSRELVFTPLTLDNYFSEFENNLKNQGLNEKDVDIYKNIGKQISKSLLEYASKDSYKESRSFKKYETKNTLGSWSPTPPDYFDGLEPFWFRIKLMCLDSANQFRPIPPTEYTEQKESKFMNELYEVYNSTSKNQQAKIISSYWDCNPIVLKHSGHATISQKKLTPGGHWLSICRNICKSKKLNFKQSAYINSVLSIGIFDGFISCWEAKYHYNYIRPISAINKLIDPEWKPLLLTPNFPEYPSGHSVISSVSAEILTSFFGDNYKFIDSSEVKYGNQPRQFNSFYEARDEAAISRLYGGIHFMPAIRNGKVQGESIGKYIIKKLKVKSL